MTAAIGILISIQKIVYIFFAWSEKANDLVGVSFAP
jgi:hypothetical protein